MPRKIIRGLEDIRTVSRPVDDRNVPHRAYMKLSVLEMEKFRRGKERQNALAKVSQIDQRFRDIEVEKRGIMAALSGQAVQVAVPPLLGVQEGAPRRAFKIKY
jgi:hypothetical protein